MKLDYAFVFLLGFFSCALVFVVYFGFGGITGFVITEEPVELRLPSDWVADEDVFVFNDEVVIKIDGATLSSYEPTGSMRPVLGVGATGIRVVPLDADVVGVGDIVSFRKDGALIVHRVVEKGFDEVGVYFITKGDNSGFADEKIRFEDIEYVTVGVIW